MNNVHCGKFLFSLKPILVVSMEWLFLLVRLPIEAFQNTDSEPSSCYFSIYSWYLSVFEAKSIDGGCHMNPSWRFDIATITGGYFHDISHIFPYFPYFPYDGFHSHGGTPIAGWSVYFMENPSRNRWFLVTSYHHFRKPQIFSYFPLTFQKTIRIPRPQPFPGNGASPAPQWPVLWRPLGWPRCRAERRGTRETRGNPVGLELQIMNWGVSMLVSISLLVSIWISMGNYK